MAVFHESDAAAAGGSKKITPVMIAIIVLVVLLCCCCAAAITIYLLRGTLGLVKKESYLPLYLVLRTWL
jgi:hypothetical protein